MQNYTSKFKSSKKKLEIRNLELEIPWNQEITRRWLPVDMYIGGAEHAVLHLLYSRFLTMVFKDLGYLDFEEPFTKFRVHGLLIKDGAKMSKSKGNIITPDKYIAKYGADTFRCYLMFLGPLSAGGDFKDTGMVGMYKFLARVYRLCQKTFENCKIENSPQEAYWQHKTIKRVTEGINRLKYNTAIAALMEYVNYLAKRQSPSSKSIKTLILLLAPFAPHLTEELWQLLCGPGVGRSGKDTSEVKSADSSEVGESDPGSVHHQPWPKYNSKYIKEDKVEIVIQVNGKIRDLCHCEQSEAISERQIINLALKSPKIQKYLKGKKIKRTVFVKGKLINFVV